MNYYKYHIFFCTNLREGGRKCCQQAGAEEIRIYAKQKIKSMGLAGKGGVRVNQAGCMGRCKEGPVLVIYPEGVWYTYQSTNDIDEIIEKHIIHGKSVTRLLISD